MKFIVLNRIIEFSIHYREVNFVKLIQIASALTSLCGRPFINHLTTNVYYHYSDVIMSAMTSQITGVSIVFSNVCSCTDHRKHQSSVTGLCEGNSPVTGDFPSQRATNAENVSIWRRHHDYIWSPGVFAILKYFTHSLWPACGDVIWCHWSWWTLLQVVTYAVQSPELVLTCCLLEIQRHISMPFCFEIQIFSLKIMALKFIFAKCFPWNSGFNIFLSYS